MIFALFVIKRMLEEIRINTKDKNCTQEIGVENGMDKARKNKTKEGKR